MAEPKFYVVWKGRQPGIFKTWDECKAQVDGFPGAQYKAFTSQQEAKRAFAGSAEDYIRPSAARAASASSGLNAPYQAKQALPTSKLRAPNGPRPLEPSLCVDGACEGNPGPMEYQCVRYPTGEHVFQEGPFQNGTNNIGEFLAIVQALQYCHAHHLALPIYSDSRIAIGWVKADKCKTQQTPNRSNAQLFERIANAEEWLATQRPTNPILKWETALWGENPADFGRK